jgi:hypothetical protein
MRYLWASQLQIHPYLWDSNSLYCNNSHTSSEWSADLSYSDNWPDHTRSPHPMCLIAGRVEDEDRRQNGGKGDDYAVGLLGLGVGGEGEGEEGEENG